MEKFKIALVGNTNAGKTTLLNTLCGLNQETSNYPGTTVELFRAKIIFKNIEHSITDLPGVYSLTPYSEEEKVAREILQAEKFDLVVQVIEPQFKKRSLSLTLEFMELELPLFIVINNKDYSWHQADYFLQKLQKEIGISGISVNALEKETKQTFFNKVKTIQKINLRQYKKILNQVHNSLHKEIEQIKNNLIPVLNQRLNLWVILKILEGDQELIAKYTTKKHAPWFKKVIDRDYSFEIKRNRFLFIDCYFSGYLGVGRRQGGGEQCHHCQKNCEYCFWNTDKIDRILLNKWFGIPIFLGLMWLVFDATFILGAIPINWIDRLINILQEKLSAILPQGLFSSFLIDGIIGSMGAIVVFLPTIMLLFFFLSILQQSGYLARIAYLLDNLMQKIGLGGKSFVPLLMGFGCSVPAIMATRTLMSRREKLITSLMIPFMSCGAKLPVYTLFISAFFAKTHQGSILFGLYVFGIVMGVLSGLFFNQFTRNQKSHLLLELPAYIFPKLKNLWRSVWNAAKEFLYKAGTIILPFSVALWFLFSFSPPFSPLGKGASIEISYAARISKAIEPLFKPLGFDWRISAGLISGLGAKEIFVATFGTIYSLDQEDKAGLIIKLQNDPVFTPISVISLLVFILLYTPCMATIGILKQEFGWKWAIAGIIYPVVLAWVVSFLIYQIGLFLF